MINESLQFLAEELNKYLNLKIPGGDVNTSRVVVSNIASTSDNTIPHPEIKEIAVLTLINIEEDSVIKNQAGFKKQTAANAYTKPPVCLNLYILFSVQKEKYSASLDLLSYIIRFFQDQHVFTPFTYSGLHSSNQKLIVEMQSMSFEQVDHIWSFLGGKYQPSVVYKVRQMTLPEDSLISEGGGIKEIT